MRYRRIIFNSKTIVLFVFFFFRFIVPLTRARLYHSYVFLSFFIFLLKHFMNNTAIIDSEENIESAVFFLPNNRSRIIFDACIRRVFDSDTRTFARSFYIFFRRRSEKRRRKCRAILYGRYVREFRVRHVARTEYYYCYCSLDPCGHGRNLSKSRAYTDRRMLG